MDDRAGIVGRAITKIKITGLFTSSFDIIYTIISLIFAFV